MQWQKVTKPRSNLHVLLLMLDPGQGGAEFFDHVLQLVVASFVIMTLKFVCTVSLNQPKYPQNAISAAFLQ